MGNRSCTGDDDINTLLPFETSQKRFFDLLATAPNDKRFVSYDAAHIAALGNEGKREVADWFDRYLGPARQRRPTS